jgi:C1A family cysteine protease
VIVVGYDDEARIASHKGAFRIRNSWGTAWGAAGYGWLPYDLLGTPAVSDAWLLVSAKWASSVLNP